MGQVDRQAALLNLCKLLLDEDRLKNSRCIGATNIAGRCFGRAVGCESFTRAFAQAGRSWSGQPVYGARCECYQLDSQQILKLKKLLFARDEAREPQSPEEKDLAKFIKRDQVVQLPVHPAKLRLVLNWLVDKFQPDIEYTERAVNELLKDLTGDPVAADHVTLRRLLIDHGLLVRQAGIYQRR